MQKMKLGVGMNVVAVAHTFVLSLPIARGCAGIFLSLFPFPFAVYTYYVLSNLIIIECVFYRVSTLIQCCIAFESINAIIY